ncbi:MAG: SUMF1/EgtB/PvdO family nonheme iron enzyme, partial [Candidatus Hydrogenedentes bacterium]|nr:SUMF1/EgtB/PvdO family nonheme iron enzyme [Candidatus Hydrogenedentota bacterium]
MNTWNGFVTIRGILVVVFIASFCGCVPKVTLTVNVEPYEGGTVNQEPDWNSFKKGDLVSLTAYASDGYIFNGWSGDIENTKNPLIVTLEQSIKVTVNFSVVVDSVEGDPEEGEIIEIGQEGENEGETTVEGEIEEGEVTEGEGEQEGEQAEGEVEGEGESVEGESSLQFDFTWSSEYSWVGQDIDFTVYATDVPEKIAEMYSWDFGDGNTASGKVVTHQFLMSGVYPVALMVTVGDSEVQISHDIYVDLAPVPDFSFTPSEAHTDTDIYFTVSAQQPGVRPIRAYLWGFGDENNSTDSAPVHQYEEPGQYEVQLTIYYKHSQATDISPSESNSTSQYVTVYPEPVEGEGEPIEELTITLPGDVPLVLVNIPSGSFLMGRYPDERFSNEREAPQHTVNILNNFYIGKFEITQLQWLTLMGSWPGSAPDAGTGDNFPANFLSWDDAQNFVVTLNEHLNSTGQDSFTVRLPSESEWEYACRAGTTTRFYFGDSLDCADDEREDCAAGVLPGNRSDYMWYLANQVSPGTQPVGGKLSNAFGLYDMSGSVYEWVEDYWHDNYVGAPNDGSAWKVPSTSFRIIRGGSWGSRAGNCRSATCFDAEPTRRTHFIGFRIAAKYSGEGEGEGEPLEGEGEPVEGEGEPVEGEGEATYHGEDYFFPAQVGYGIQYNITDSINALDTEIWAVSQPHDSSRDFVYTFSGYIQDSSLGGRNNYLVDGRHYTLFNAGYPSVGQAFMMIFDCLVIPSTFHDDDFGTYTFNNLTWDGENFYNLINHYSIDVIGSAEIDGNVFEDCIAVYIDNTEGTSPDSVRGTGHYILARDIGVVSLDYVREYNSSVVTYRYLSHGMQQQNTISGTVYQGCVPLAGIHVQLHNADWGIRSTTDMNGDFSLQAYGPEITLRLGYDENEDGTFDEYVTRERVRNIVEDTFVPIYIGETVCEGEGEGEPTEGEGEGEGEPVEGEG